MKLCDLASGAFTHSLVGHRDAIWALHWSLTSEWHLFTSAADGQVCSKVENCKTLRAYWGSDGYVMVSQSLAFTAHLHCRSDCGTSALQAAYMSLISMIPTQPAAQGRTGQLLTPQCFYSSHN